MPGRHLNDAERRLAEFWQNPPPSLGPPLLKGVSLQGPPSLRGIERIHVPFEYPITAISGRNGAGKSTILALTAFSACRPASWRTGPRPFPPVRPSLRSMSFAWDEFFFRRLGDQPLSGLTVSFTSTHRGNDIQVSRTRTANGRWALVPDPGRSRAPQLPERPIDFVSLARILPPAEFRSLRQRFATPNPANVTPLDESTVSAMSLVLGQTYQSISLQTEQGAALAQCAANARYNGFDMGSGENSAVAILSALERLPPGGLLLIEEIEHGFHPEAQTRLIGELTRVVSRKKTQIICTTHSEYIIDALPQQGRLLIERVPDGHRVNPAPTTNQAMFTMTGRPRPELTIYVEDAFARTLVEQALRGEQRKRVRVIPIGSADRVVSQLGTHLAAPLDGPAIGIVDGDCSDSKCEQWMRRDNVPVENDLVLRLPGSGNPPEHWVLETLREQPYSSNLARQVQEDVAEVLATLVAMGSLSDIHDLPREFSLRHGLATEHGPYILSCSVADHPDLNRIRQVVASRLTLGT